jgi:excisionase family DNA binding protein
MSAQGNKRMADNPTDLDSDVLSIEELATRLDISLTTAYKLARKNALPIPVIRIGPQYRFSRRAYEALISGTSEPIGPDAA